MTAPVPTTAAPALAANKACPRVIPVPNAHPAGPARQRPMAAWAYCFPGLTEFGDTSETTGCTLLFAAGCGLSGDNRACALAIASSHSGPDRSDATDGRATAPLVRDTSSDIVCSALVFDVLRFSFCAATNDRKSRY